MSNSVSSPEGDFSFEKALQRLEQILEKMNLGTTTLDESLKLYEEADTLIAGCSKRLNEAEKKVEQLLKNRQGETAIGPDGQPTRKEFF